jgi:hypothetical protein
MRSWVICLFVMLLPWRLWAADAMALQMVEWPQAPAQHQPCHGTAHEVAHDSMAVDDSFQDAHHAHTSNHPSTDLTDHGSHGMCLLCDVCHNALGMSPQGQTPHTQTPHLPHTALTARMASAVRQPGYKPPIG